MQKSVVVLYEYDFVKLFYLWAFYEQIMSALYQMCLNTLKHHKIITRKEWIGKESCNEYFEKDMT